jgi:D-inositol-3-phosphate glycosyltransferase
MIDIRSQKALGILVSPGVHSYDGILKQRTTGYWSALRRAFRPHRTSDHGIRGHVVAAKNVVEALLCNSRTRAYELFIHAGWQAAALNEHIKQCGLTQGSETRRIRVSLLGRIITGGLDGSDLLAWFDPLPTKSPSSGIEISQRIRKHHASLVYPITTLMHGLSLHPMLYEGFSRFLLEESLACDSIICTTNTSRSALSHILDHLAESFYEVCGGRPTYRGRVDVIPLCVNTQKLCPRDRPKVRDRLKLKKDAFIILTLGRISLKKADLCPFVPVLRALVDRNPNKHLLWVIAGTEDKGYSDSVLAAAREAGVRKHVSVLVNISDETKEHLLPAADVFLSLSDTVQESFGLAPIEAMSCGVPQVVSDWDGHRDTIVHGLTGFRVPTTWMDCTSDLANTGTIAGPGYDHLCLGQSIAIDMKQTGDYLQCLIENENMRREMGHCSRVRALEMYSFESVAKKYDSLWAELAEISQLVQRRQTTGGVDRPFYFEFFSHYATRTLQDEAVLRLSPSARAGASARRFRVNSVLAAGHIFDDSILQLIVETLKRGKSGDRRDYAAWATEESPEIALGDLVGTLRTITEKGPDVLRRHIMWLIKYGIVEFR